MQQRGFFRGTRQVPSALLAKRYYNTRLFAVGTTTTAVVSVIYFVRNFRTFFFFAAAAGIADALLKNKKNTHKNRTLSFLVPVDRQLSCVCKRVTHVKRSVLKPVGIIAVIICSRVGHGVPVDNVITQRVRYKVYYLLLCLCSVCVFVLFCVCLVFVFGSILQYMRLLCAWYSLW